MKDILRIGAYQLTRLSRVPTYAAVQTAVELAKGAGARRSAGLVNAVLRRLSSQQPSPAPTDTALADQYSHPEWLVDRWVTRWGPARTEALLAHNNRPPPLTLQPVRWSRERLHDALVARGIRVEPAPGDDGIVVSGVEVKSLPGYGQGAFIVQDAAQARLLRYAEVKEGARVWDACAAPGGKTASLTSRCRLFASDLKIRRLAILRDTLHRLAVSVPVFAADASQPPLRPIFDVVLVDAPCSATGTMNRHPDARWQLSPRRIEQLAHLQARILDGASSAVRPGGLLVYLTCSLEPEENGCQVEAFLERHPEFAREGDDLYIFPPDAGTDGGYGARLRREP